MRGAERQPPGEWVEGQGRGTEGGASVSEVDEGWEQVDPGLVGRAGWEVEEAQRDVEVLEWVGRFRFVTAKAIAEEFEVSWQRANARVRRLEREGLLGLERRYASQARAVFLTGRGATLLGWERHRAPRPDVHREHEEAIVWLVTQLERRDEETTVLTERECRRLERDTGRRYSVDVVGSSRNDRKRWPDVVLDHGTHRHAIEIEFAPKSAKRLQAIVYGYAIGRTYERVTFLVKSPALGKRLRQVASRWSGGGSQHRIQVSPWPGLSRDDREQLARALQ